VRRGGTQSSGSGRDRKLSLLRTPDYKTALLRFERSVRINAIPDYNILLLSLMRDIVCNLFGNDLRLCVLIIYSVC
jgi:hypothetical protein